MTAAARSLLRAPYRWASMTVDASPGRWRYVGRRRYARPVAHQIEVEVGPPLEAADVSPLDIDLTALYRAVMPVGAGRLTVPVRHEPWPLHSATILHLEEDLLDAAGLGAPGEAPSVRWSPGVDSVIGIPQWQS